MNPQQSPTIARTLPSHPTLVTHTGNGPTSIPRNHAVPRGSSEAFPIIFTTFDGSANRPRASQLPALSSSTEQILDRVRAKPYGDMEPNRDPPKDLNPGPNFATSPAPQHAYFSKADLKSTLTTNLAPKSGVLPSQRIDPRANPAYHFKTDSDSNLKNSEPEHRLSQAIEVEDTIIAEGSAIATEPTTSTTMQGLWPQTTLVQPPVRPPTALGRPPSSSRKVHSYVLPDGTVTASGKGLGRGRPGIKRGPRKSKLSTEVTVEQSETSMPPPAPAPAPNTPAPSLKRKRTHSSSSENFESHLSRSISSTPEYTPQSTQTRSGRQTQKPTAFVPPSSPAPNPLPTASSPSTPVSAASRKGRPDSSTPNSNGINPRPTLTHPKIKRRIYRGAAREQMALCEHCLRGNGPVGNAIVFCDACNRCWHQRCHDPAIPRHVVNDAKAEWVCVECDSILRGKKKGKQAKKSSDASSSLYPTIDTSDRGAFKTPSIPIGLVGGSMLTRDQRVAFLSKLGKDRLIDLVLRASDLAPLLPLFEDPNPAPPPQSLTPKYNTSVQTQADEDEGFQSGDEGYEYYGDEHVYLYPRPGHGVKLPPDSTDLAMLLEGPECKTFSHWVAPAGTLGVVPTSGTAQLSV